MSFKKIYVDLDFEKISQILNFRIHNVTTSQRNGLGVTLGVLNVGLSVYDTDEKVFYIWNGSTWASAGGSSSIAWGSITGTLSAQVDLQAALNLKVNTSALATVAFSGAYADLSGKPTLLSDFTNNVGFLTTEVDPTVPAHVKAISSSDINNWNAAFGWGNHALAGYATLTGTEILTNKTLTSPVINFGGDTDGDIIIRQAGNYTRLPIGINGQVLGITGGLPAWQAVPAMTTLNTLTATVQTFAVGTTGTDFNIQSAGTVHTFHIPSASATNRGLVTNGSQTFAGTKTFGSIVFGGVGETAWKPNTSNSSSTSDARYLFSDPNTQFKFAVGGGNNNVLVNSGALTYANFVVANAGVTGSSIGGGSHTLIANAAIRALSVTNGTQAIANTATLYIQGASSATVTGGFNHALWIESGLTRLGGLLRITVSEFADNAAALAGSLVIGDVYRTGDFLKVVH